MHHRVELEKTGNWPIHSGPCFTVPIERELEKQGITWLLSMDAIKPAQTASAPQTVCVQRKDRTLRLFRGLLHAERSDSLGFAPDTTHGLMYQNFWGIKRYVRHGTLIADDGKSKSAEYVRGRPTFTSWSFLLYSLALRIAECARHDSTSNERPIEKSQKPICPCLFKWYCHIFTHVRRTKQSCLTSIYFILQRLRNTASDNCELLTNCIDYLDHVTCPGPFQLSPRTSEVIRPLNYLTTVTEPPKF